jgi:diguanylate cyclase (GGDEF)-like protein
VLLLAALLLGVAAMIAAGAIRQKALHRAADQALSDALTGLPTRRLLDARLQASLARATRTGTSVVVVYGDLDGFKAVNDAYGHRRGDALLKEVARRLELAVRAEDLVVRLGGDEFVVLAEGVTGMEQVQELTDRIVASIAEPVRLDRAVVSVGISLGAVITRRGTPSVLLEAADAAMYDAKKAGRGPVIRPLGVLDRLGEARLPDDAAGLRAT